MTSAHGLLVDAVRRRLCVASAARRGAQATLASAAVLLLALLSTRLLGWHPEAVRPWMAALPAALGLLLAGLLFRRHSRVEAARRIDEAAATKDLFLSATLATPATDAYAPLVERDANRAAAGLQAAAVVPFAPARGALCCAAALALLAAGAAWLPPADPFGLHRQEDALAKLREDLREQKKALDLRMNNLARPEDGLSAEVKQNLAKLKQTLDALKPATTNENRQALAQSQKDLGEVWKKLNPADLKNTLADASAKQSLGAESPKASTWKQELAQGKTEGLQRELQELAKMAAELAKTGDPEKKARLTEDIKQRMQDVQNFAKQNLGRSGLSEQMGQAQSQLQTAQIQQLADQALQNLQQQLQLSQSDMQSLAEQMKNMQDVEDALKALQQAQRCNQGGKCDGSQTGAFKDLQQYAQWYKQMMEQLAQQGDGEGEGKGSGEGMKGPGRGEGGKAEQDQGQITQFDPQKNPGLLSAGKILMEWKTKEIAPTGAAREEYARNLQTLKQNVNEALIEEQIPPGYHEAIQSYFDRLPEAPAAEKKSADL